MHIWIWEYMKMWIYIYVYMKICIYENMYICKHVFMYICIYANMWISIYVYVSICKRKYVYVHMCTLNTSIIQKSIYIYRYLNLNTYIPCISQITLDLMIQNIAKWLADSTIAVRSDCVFVKCVASASGALAKCGNSWVPCWRHHDLRQKHWQILSNEIWPKLLKTSYIKPFEIPGSRPLTNNAIHMAGASSRSQSSARSLAQTHVPKESECKTTQVQKSFLWQPNLNFCPLMALKSSSKDGLDLVDKQRDALNPDADIHICWGTNCIHDLVLCSWHAGPNTSRNYSLLRVPYLHTCFTSVGACGHKFGLLHLDLHQFGSMSSHLPSSRKFGLVSKDGLSACKLAIKARGTRRVEEPLVKVPALSQLGSPCWHLRVSEVQLLKQAKRQRIAGQPVAYPSKIESPKALQFWRIRLVFHSMLPRYLAPHPPVVSVVLWSQRATLFGSAESKANKTGTQIDKTTRFRSFT